MSVNVCPVLTFLPNTKRGSGDREREREFRTEMRGEDESQFFEENRHVILHNFFELQYVSVAFLQYLSYLSLSCTLSLSFSISHSLSVAVWSFWRPLHSISHWRCRRVSLCSLKPDSPQISPFAPYVLWDWRRHAFYICGFFLKNLPKSSATLNPKSSSSSVASEDEAGPFLRNGFKKMYLAFL